MVIDCIFVEIYCKYFGANADVIKVELFEVVLQSKISLLSAC